MADTATAAAPRQAPHRLDDVMLAMDVVDTLRHQEVLVARELDETRREAELIERLRQIYRSQGIEVPDSVLAEGVKALNESRFVYTPPRPGLAVTLAKLWVSRARYGKALGAALLAVGLAWGGYYFGVVRPTEIEIGRTVPRALDDAHKAALAEAKVDAARERADRFLALGRAALERRDAAAARQAAADLEALRADLQREYTLRIVSTAFRVPERALHQRNYYLIVEAVAPDGGLLSLPITSEEDGSTAVVTRWGVRVSPEVALQVVRDREDDGVIQNDRLGEKRRGHPDVDYAMPVLGGTITRW
jgi:hypothetical protein